MLWQTLCIITFCATQRFMISQYSKHSTDMYGNKSVTDSEGASNCYQQPCWDNESRITSVCYTNTITSSGEPLYLTNPGYPGATIGKRSCSCSFEAQSCSTGTSHFIIDADLYPEPSTCNQSVLITDVDGVLRESIKCENYYTTFVTQNNLISNYYNVHFESNSSQNLEGYLFIGFAASDSNVPFSLSCSSKSAAWCIDCGKPNNTIHGTFKLDATGKSGYNSTVTVTCDSGFVANTTKITCKEHGIWESASCTQTDACPQPTDYRCADGECLSRATKCDYFPDCKDRSDETNCPGEPCSEFFIRCFFANGTSSCVAGSKCAVDGELRESIKCESYYDSFVTQKNLMSNYYNIYFESNSTQNLEGYLFIGLTAGCGPSQWQCQNGECIDTSARCDSFPDCRDETDEMNCTDTITCNEGWRKCFHSDGTFTCTYQTTPCDCGFPVNNLYGTATLDVSRNSSTGASATVTCDNGYQTSMPKIICLPTGLWTNTSCTKIASCGPSQWQCQNGQCISNSFRCDNFPDCNDRSDEQNCTGTDNCNEYWRKCFHSDGTFTCTDPDIPCDCGPVPSISAGDITLQDPKNTTYGATASVKCATGYQAYKNSISCQSSGMWEPTNCTAIDCGKLPPIPAGSLILVDPNNTSYGSSATVTCFTGYQANFTSISCLSSGLWENAICRAVAIEKGSVKARLQYLDICRVYCTDRATSLPIFLLLQQKPICYLDFEKNEHLLLAYEYICPGGGHGDESVKDSLLPATSKTRNDNNNTILLIVLVLVFGLASLIQLCVATCLYVIIYRTDNPDAGKAVSFIFLSAIPYIGIAFIIRFHKWSYKTVHERAHFNPQQLDIINRNSADTHKRICKPSDKNDYGKSKGVEDRKNAADDDTALHYDYIDLESEAENTHNTRGIRAMENFAVSNSGVELHDGGKEYQHLRPERRHSDRYTELRSGNLREHCVQYTNLQSGNLLKGSDQCTNLQSDDLQKDSDQYTKLQSDDIQLDSNHYKNLDFGNL